MTLRITLWNVQHGSAAYIQTPNGKGIAIDLGAGDGFSPLQHLWRIGRRLDHIIITHPHMDHIDDILNLNLVSPVTLLTPRHLTEDDIRGGNPKPNQELEAKIQKYLEVRREYSYAVEPQNDVGRLENNGGISIQTFIPYLSSTGNLNNHSVVTVLEYSGVKILIPGDNESASWKELLNRRDFLTVITGTQVLVAAHHGRESGYYRDLFDYFLPLITLISDGRTVDTSATARYTNLTQGWPVRRRNGTMQGRKCVTTRNDGHIEVTIFPGTLTQQPVLEVLID